MYHQKYLKYISKYLALAGITEWLHGGTSMQKINELQINANIVKKKYAIVTLLMMGDSYLPGALVMAYSILRFGIPENIDLVCMITNDISDVAKHDLEQYFDRVILVDYIQVSPKDIHLKNEIQKNVYSKTFTKLHAFELVEYEKIVLIDLDMIILQKKFFDIFNYEAPAAVITACIFFNEDCEMYKKYFIEKFNVRIKEGEKIPHQVFENFVQSIITNRNYKDVETSICLLKPSIDDYNYMVKKLNDNIGKYRGDTDLLAEYYKYQWYAIDPSFLGRWGNQEKIDQRIVLDLYGFKGKPWELDKYEKIKDYYDVKYWYNMFMDFYRETFKEKCKHTSIHLLYTFLDNKHI